MNHRPVDYYDEEKWGEAILTKSELFDRERKSLGIIKDVLPKGKFLDVGCGLGFFMDHLNKVNPKLQIHGVDYSTYNLKQAKKRLPFTFKRCNIEDGIPYEDKFFDMVYAAEFIEHIVDPDYFIEESYRILKPGGYILITTPNLVSWYNRLLMMFGVQPIFYETSTRSPKIGSGPLKAIKQGTIPVGHIRIFTIRAIQDLLVEQGFEVVTVKGANFAALPAPLRFIDTLFTIYPRLSSGMLVLGRKRKNSAKNN